jgi:hypothetical protein
VRNRLREGRHPLPGRQQSAGMRKKRTPQSSRSVASDTESQQASEVDYELTLQGLKKDPSLRLSEGGRVLLRWLDAQAAGLEKWKSLADSIPAHWTQLVAKLAYQNSEFWREFARYIENQERSQQ